MEQIKVLRQICQSPRKAVDNWHMKYISRKPSIYITWALLHTPITANGATFLFLLTGIIASLAFAAGTKLSFLIGSLLLQFWYVMDMVDGEIARYKKQSSLTGVYFDCICHYITHPFMFFCIGLGLYFMESNNPVIFLISLLAGYSVTMINVSTDVMRSVLCGSTKNSFSGPDIDKKQDSGRRQNLLSRGFSILHMLCVMPAIMDTLFLFTLVDFLAGTSLTSWLIKFYAVGATIVWVARIGFFIITKKIDREYK